MTRNPIVSALSATAYILLVVLGIQFGSTFAPEEDSFLLPVAMLSLFVLSAAVMAYLFFYQPLLLYVEGQKERAITLFLRTLGVFALSTVVLLGTVFFLAS